MAKSGEHRMLFDLRGKRRRFVQVVYATLALLMGGGLIFFGIGSDVQGGLFDAFDDQSGSTDTAFDEQAQKLEQKLKSDPKNPQLLVATARAWYTSANSQVEYDPATGAPLDFPEGAIADFTRSGDAWNRYLATKPAKPNPNVAGLAATALFYSAASATSAPEFETRIGDAVRAQEVFAEARPTLNAYITLSRYRFFAGDFAGGEEAARNAKKEAPKGQAPAIDAAVAQYRRQGKQITKQLKAASKFQPGSGGEQALQSPLGGLAGGGTGAPAPAP